MANAKNTTQLNVGISTELYDRVQQFKDARGETLRVIVEGALIRHMMNPPPVPVPPPPPVYPPLPPIPSPQPAPGTPTAKGEGQPARKGKGKPTA